MINLLVAELDRQAPGGLRADREMTVRLAKRQAPEPDVVVVTSEAYERDPATESFGLTGIHHNQLKVTTPFALDIDLTSVGKRSA